MSHPIRVVVELVSNNLMTVIGIQKKNIREYFNKLEKFEVHGALCPTHLSFISALTTTQYLLGRLRDKENLGLGERKVSMRPNAQG